MSQTNEWPKEWNDILPEQKTVEEHYLSNAETWISLGPSGRVYEGTFYVCSAFGDPDSKVEDEWMPFDIYVREQIQEESKKLNEEFASQVIENI